MNVTALREQFPITRWGTYLDHGSRCPTPQAVLERQEAFARFCAQRGRDYAAWWTMADNLRARIAALINAEAAEICYASSTTHALNLLAQGYPWKAGDVIVAAQMEFPSNVYPWLGLAEKGVEVRMIQPQDGRITLEMIRDALDARTRLVALSHVQAANGFRLNLQEVGQLCHSRDIVFCVDATQSLGAYEVDVERDGIDFLACSTYKWLMASDGLAVCFCRAQLLPSLKLSYYGWSGRCDRNEFYTYPMKYPSKAQRFELGNPNFSALAALEAALDLRDEIGGEVILGRTQQVVDCFYEALRGIEGVMPVGDFAPDHRGALITLRLEHAPRVFEGLTRRRIATALRREGIRISPYFYNTSEEADLLARALRELTGGGAA